MAKNTKCFNYGNLYNDKGLNMLERQYTFAKKVRFGQISKL